jgi:hypothetical protein
LLELQFERQRTALLEKSLADAEALRPREGDLAAKELALEQERTAAAQEKAAQALERAEAERKRGDDLDLLLERALKKPSKWCVLLKILMLGQKACI